MKRYRHRQSFQQLQKTHEKFLVLLGIVLLSSTLLLHSQEQEPAGLKFVQGRVFRLTVPSDAPWTDSGYDVEGDQILSFGASGGISLQIGNPMAYCGPDGYDLKTVQQPMQNQNIGSLIGKVVLLISIEVDEETGEETRNEMVEIFHIGSERIITMPLSGRLFLGVNENVAGDNSGQFTVDIRLVDR
jgi:hypothetical protein